MHIKGFQGTSLLDFPGRISALVFTGGCNLTCPFCHNPGLVLEPAQYPDYPVDEVLHELENRRNFIDGVVLSGGEPTLDPDLLPFLRQLKKLGLQTKLDTNGLLPEIIRAALNEELLDFVALDIKTTPERYSELHTAAVDPEMLRNSIEILLQASCELEFRTTCVPGWVDATTIETLGTLIQGAPIWALQQFHAGHALDPGLQSLEPYPPETLEKFSEMASRFVDEVVIRGL